MFLFFKTRPHVRLGSLSTSRNIGPVAADELAVDAVIRLSAASRETLCRL